MRYWTTSELFQIQEKVSNEMIQYGNFKSAKTKTALTSVKKKDNVAGAGDVAPQ